MELSNSKIRIFITLLTLFLFSFIPLNAFAQEQGFPSMDAGEDVILECGEDCVELSANFIHNEYGISSINYNPHPSQGGEELFVIGQIDDFWSNILNLPFDFCFFGESYNEMLISSNGVITFDLVANQPFSYCDWVMDSDALIPSPNLFSASIFSPFTDINLIAGGSIKWLVVGEAPSRKIICNFRNIPLFSAPCSDLLLTTQLVLYETTNIIEIHITNKPSGCDWNNGLAALGLQNKNGTQGYAPAGRNTGEWAAYEEAWRFTPIGSNPEFAWLNENGEIIGTTTTITVCPDEDNTVYTAIGTWVQCDGTEVEITDDVTVHFNTFDCFCAPSGTNETRFINDFGTTGGIENIENNNSGFAFEGYGDYSDNQIVSQQVGSSINFEANIEGEESGFRIWVDWNMDGVFDPVEEITYESSNYASLHTGFITVPDNAQIGNTRMRIVSNTMSTTGDVDPCETAFEFGEFEDYSFNVERLVGVGDMNAKNLILFPNPSNYEWNLNASNLIENVTVFNLLGQSLATINFNSNEVSIDASKLPVGTYILKVSIEGVINIIKVIRE